MISFLNTVIILMLILTFFTLLAGLIYSARSGDDPENKINKFMRYRVYIQLLSLIVLVLALYLKENL